MLPPEISCFVVDLFCSISLCLQVASLCGVRWCSNTIFMVNTFPRLKKSCFWKTSSVSKEEIFYVHFHSHGIARNGVITKRMNFNCPVVETSESTEPDDNLELNAIAYTFSKIYQPELKQFLRRSWTSPCLRLFGFLSEANGETFFAMEDFTLLWWHSGTQKHIGRAKQNEPNRQRSNTFLEKNCQNRTSKPE